MEEGWTDYLRKMLAIFDAAEKEGGRLTDDQLNDLENLLDAALGAVQFVEAQREAAYEEAGGADAKGDVAAASKVVTPESADEFIYKLKV